MIRATAGPGRNTRSATAADPPPRPVARRTRLAVRGPLTLRQVLRDLALLGLAAGAGTALAVGYTVHRIEAQGGRDEQRPAGAIVVLGAAQYDGRPSPVFAARIEHAVDLYLAGIAPVLVVTGGKQPNDRTTEAATARAYAIRLGVPPGAILAEDRGRSTLESLRGVADVLRQHGVSDAVFVSDQTHMLRVLRIARDQGIVAYGSPTPSSPADADPDRRLRATLHELGALAAYFLTERDASGSPVGEPGGG